MSRDNPEDFYFSSPMKVVEDGEAATTVVIVSKSQWDSYHELETSGECYLVRSRLGDLLAETEENIFQSINASIRCKDLSDKLRAIGMSHNPELDSRLREWAKKYEDQLKIEEEN